MGSCVKCDFNEPEPGSLYCTSCRRGIELLVYERPKPMPKEEFLGSRTQREPAGSHSIRGSPVPRAAGHPHTPESFPRAVERVPGHEVSPVLKEILGNLLESPTVLPPEELAGKAPRAEELRRHVAPILIDDPIRYTGDQREIELDGPALAGLAETTGIDISVLEYLLATHGRCHEAMRRSYFSLRIPAGPEYEKLDDRIREHYSQLLMYYLLFGPDWVKQLLPVRYHQSLPRSEATGFRRDFMALNTLQSGLLYVDPLDFTATKPTASIEHGVDFPARGYVMDFAKWHQHVIGRPAAQCASTPRQS